MMSSNLIVFEGIDGSGTTTQVEQLRKAFVSKGLPVHVTAQPSRGPIGMLIRQVLSGRFVTLSGKTPGWKTMSLMFAADRQDLQECEIEPALREGVNVICDRYVQSSAIYQSVSSGEEKSIDWILEINKNIRQPDLVFYLKISDKEASARRSNRGGSDEIFDDLDFQKKLSREYSKLQDIFPNVNIVTLDAEKNPEELTEEVWKIVEKMTSQEGVL